MPDEISLLSIFECEPKLSDNNAPYFYNEATYEFSNYSNERFNTLSQYARITYKFLIMHIACFANTGLYQK